MRRSNPRFFFLLVVLSSCSTGCAKKKRLLRLVVETGWRIQYSDRISFFFFPLGANARQLVHILHDLKFSSDLKQMMATSRDNVTKLIFHRVVIEDTDWWRHIEYSETTNDTWGLSFGCQRRSCDGLVSTRRYTHLFHMFEQVSSSEYQRNVATRSVQPWRNRLDMPSRTKAFQLTNAHLWTLYSAELQFLSTDDKCGTIRCNARLCHSTSVEI